MLPNPNSKPHIHEDEAHEHNIIKMLSEYMITMDNYLPNEHCRSLAPQVAGHRGTLRHLVDALCIFDIAKGLQTSRHVACSLGKARANSKSLCAGFDDLTTMCDVVAWLNAPAQGTPWPPVRALTTLIETNTSNRC